MKSKILLLVGFGFSIVCQGMSHSAGMIEDSWAEYRLRHEVASDAWECAVACQEQFKLAAQEKEDIRNDNSTVVRHVIQRADSRVLDTVLLEAATVGAYHVVQQALLHGAKIDPEDVHTIGKARIAMMDIFSGDNPLLAATRNGHALIVKLLLDNGAYPNAPRGRCGAGETPLQVAAKNGDTKIVKMLLEAGASNDIFIIGFSALEIARKKGYTYIVDAIEKPTSRIIDGSRLELPECDI